MKNFFEREATSNYQTGYLPLAKKFFTHENILSYPKSKILSFYRSVDKQDFLAYRFEVLRKWMIANERYTYSYFNNLQTIIDKLYLDDDLNSYEQQYIRNIQDVVFAKMRNLKQLIVDFEIEKSELIFYRYEIKSFNEIIDNDVRTHFSNCDVYITTKRLVVSEHINTLSLPYELIKNYEFKMNELIINMNNGKKYSIKCNEIPTIYVSLERVLHREKIFLNK